MLNIEEVKTMNRIRDAIYGFAIGDAMGVPIEFEHRDKLRKNPVTKMLGYGSYNICSGVWSDDTSMTLATMDSIAELKKIDYDDMTSRFCEWINEAKYTATGEVFDIGITTRNALIRYYNNHIDATKCGGTSISENGNGSLMRMMPIAFYAYYKELDDDSIYDIVLHVSSITHAHEISIMGCYMYVKYLVHLLNGNDKFSCLRHLRKLDYKWFSNETKEEYKRILSGEIKKLEPEDIVSTGYVVFTLEAVLWIINNTESFSEAIVGAINLGEDTDTIGAISGSIAGILYGYNSIPEEWINDLKNKEYLDYMARKYSKAMELI